MITFSIEIIETTVVVVIMIVLRLLSRSAVSRALKKFNFSYQRRKLILKLINVLVVVLGLLAIIAIWGIKQEDLFIFLSSLLTVLGIAFFAQWSLLSNITSGLILFFNHPVKLGDTIKIHDKEFPIEGQVKDIGYYFVHLETLEGERLTIPNSALIQKMVSIKHISEQ
jgi:small-conductance mechanosensitive channel